MRTDSAIKMKTIVDDVAPVLKAAGFRKRRHSFNRSVGGQLTHVIDFQMGAFQPPGTEEIIGLRPDLYGNSRSTPGSSRPTCGSTRIR
jgi:hypothetical protein